MISPIYTCPNCGSAAFVVNGRLPGKYLIGACLNCSQSSTIPESSQEIKCNWDNVASPNFDGCNGCPRTCATEYAV